MPDNLPANFDAKRYLAAYPDVALTGIDPAEHYLWFGRLMGRSPSGKEAAGKPEQPQPLKAAEKAADTSGSDIKQRKATAPAKPAKTQSAIVDRPVDFDPQEVVPAPAPSKRGASDDGAFTLAVLAEGFLDSAAAPLVAYARMFGLEWRRDADIEPALGQSRLASAEFKIENAWFSRGSALRLMISATAEFGRFALRAYQADAAAPADLRLAGAGMQLPGSGPVFHELELLNPLMPVVLELEDTHAHTRSVELMPFPSLLPGGLHSAELRALQREPNPMDAFWRLSNLLLRELLGGPDSTERSIATLSIAGEVDRTLGASEMQPWLGAIFGLGTEADKQSRGLRLELPNDCIPTISALVSRAIDRRTVHSAPFLVAEPPTFRPRWSVVFPPGSDAGPNVPRIVGQGSRSGGAKDRNAAPIHVGIALRLPPEPKLPAVHRGAAQSKRSRGGLRLSALIDASDAKRTETLVTSLRAVTAAKGLELFVTGAEDRDIAQVLENACGRGGWTAVAAQLDLPTIARAARHDMLVTVSDRVVLDEPEVLKALAAAIERDEKIASSSCVLLAEATIRKQAVLQPASGGLFPSRVSFASSPMLTFSEPDVLQALPDLTYPVVANTFLLTMWRRQAVASLASAATATTSSSDIGIGIALLQAGLRNVCTTKLSARVAGRLLRRDSIDPIGHTWIDPQQWGRILGEVTLLRQLF